MSDRDPAGHYSTEEIQRLLDQIRAEHQSAGRPGSDTAKAAVEPAAEAAGSASKKLQSNSDVTIRKELSLEEILNKIRGDIADEHPGPGNDK